MRKAIVLFSFFVTGLRCVAQYPGYILLNQPETFKKAFASATKATQSIEADFTQEKSLQLLAEKMNSKGKFWYKKGNSLRMEYRDPYEYLMILQAGKIFIKDGQKENKISANSNKTFQQVNRLLIDCVSGSMLENPDFKSTVFENNTFYLIELRPQEKNLKELYRNINIIIDRNDFTASSIGMYELSGDHTIIGFQHKKLNATIPDSLFAIP